MLDSRTRILTTHIGSLPRPAALLDMNLQRNDGEYGKSMTNPKDFGPWMGYAWECLGGWERTSQVTAPPALRDADRFDAGFILQSGATASSRAPIAGSAVVCTRKSRGPNGQHAVAE